MLLDTPEHLLDGDTAADASPHGVDEQRQAHETQREVAKEGLLGVNGVLCGLQKVLEASEAPLDRVLSARMLETVI